MDPNETLAWIDNALASNDAEHARELCDELRVWLRRGGFEPRWKDYPEAAGFYNSYCEPN